MKNYSAHYSAIKKIVKKIDPDFAEKISFSNLKTCDETRLYTQLKVDCDDQKELLEKVHIIGGVIGEELGVPYLKEQYDANSFYHDYYQGHGYAPEGNLTLFFDKSKLGKDHVLLAHEKCRQHVSERVARLRKEIGLQGSYESKKGFNVHEDYAKGTDRVQIKLNRKVDIETAEKICRLLHDAQLI